jgi:hypothetical protein
MIIIAIPTPDITSIKLSIPKPKRARVSSEYPNKTETVPSTMLKSIVKRLNKKAL